ncbi:ribosome silencing factor [Waterburya agarophytonicola K14]|uniref:Ribosomal silencing factor RsfS n=1 Tax=Waterburya agarophytonicola KI4 TaxID=2874699 RepID=A0A964BQ01_9CYAN|nr:ribosome silencing factor [Waterburya agarophytonicola]MCC0175790.1 ribosome silencing factor [Waterburya agarophytonicola KI4]
MSKLSSEQAIAIEQQTQTTIAVNSKELALQIAGAAEEKKAQDIVLLDVSDVSYLADYFVIITGFSSTQLKAIAESIEERIEDNYHRLPVRVSGKREGNWIVQDYADVIVHIFLPEEREYYNLEAFWGHAERIEYISQSS